MELACVEESAFGSVAIESMISALELFPSFRSETKLSLWTPTALNPSPKLCTAHWPSGRRCPQNPS